MTNEERWIQFIQELQAYILEHHHLPDKHRIEHRGLLNQVKYIRKKIKEGKLEEEKRLQFEALLSERSSEHTGGRRKKINTENK